MGLDELLSDDKETHPKSVKATNEKLRDEDVCPSCGGNNVREGVTFDYCENNDCETFAFKHPQYEVDLDKLWD